MTPAQLAKHIKKLAERPSRASDALHQILLDKRRLRKDSPDDHPYHWLRFLKDYNHDAAFAYNHIVCPPMLLWLPEALRVPRPLITKAFIAASVESTMALAGRCKAIRTAIPWEMVEEKLGKRTRG